MVGTDIAALSTLQTKAWVAIAVKHERDTSFWFGDNGFMGSGIRDATRPIHYVDQFTKVLGADKVVVPLVLPLDGDGRAGDRRLKGNEERLVPDSVEIRIDQLRHGVRNSGRMAELRSILDFAAQAKDALADWHAQKKDELAFLTIAGRLYSLDVTGLVRDPTSNLPLLTYAADVTAPSTNRRVFPQASITATTGIAASDKMTWDTCVRAKAVAIQKRIKPIRMGGKDYYVVVMHAAQSRDMKMTADYKSILAQAGEKGNNNPLFRGGFAMVDGLVLFEHMKVPSTFGAAAGAKYGAAGTVDGAQALLFGAQALGYGSVKGSHDPSMEQESDDYGALTGIEYYQIFGMKKPVFKSPYDFDANGDKLTEDFSVISIYTACTPT